MAISHDAARAPAVTLAPPPGAGARCRRSVAPEALAVPPSAVRATGLGAVGLRAVERARAMLLGFGEPLPDARFGAQVAADDVDALGTLLMDLFRRTGSAEVFDALVELVGPALQRRVGVRTRQLGLPFDPAELLQDALVNVYRYPDRFDASRPGAFRAWSSTIVDNAIRRKLRRARSGPDVQLRPVELLTCERDRSAKEPSETVEQTEECRRALQALGLLLGCYLRAYHELTERERFVLQMVEVRGMRYAELAQVLGIRPEALKMVVFRARRRILDKLTITFAQAGIAA
ncbi:MAG: sigma-70 family RNA polymerase sigma factor [Planctomycetes bacterium]|nr:sigma-70 family RNA polymerase sigma factor [Planctomycetota bacterium]